MSWWGNREKRAVRAPAVAGAFYPAQPTRLRAEVEALLASAPRPVDPRPPKALVVPHAGYSYSGPIAAAAYATLDPRSIERVAILGPAHTVPLVGLAAPSASGFATPLGVVEVDRDAVERVSVLPQVAVDDRAHAREHSLEVQLPFLQVLGVRAAIVPLAVGQASPGEVAEVLAQLWNGPATLVLVSTDLSHYYDDRTAKRLDATTARAIEQLAYERLGVESACGRVPLAGLLAVARRSGLEVERLALATSADTAGSPDRVVGYGAWAFRPRICGMSAA